MDEKQLLTEINRALHVHAASHEAALVSLTRALTHTVDAQKLMSALGAERTRVEGDPADPGRDRLLTACWTAVDLGLKQAAARRGN